MIIVRGSKKPKGTLQGGLNMENEKKMRYEVTTPGNCFLHGFEEWQDAVNYANALDIRVKIWDTACGVSTDWYND